ncbi:MAG: ABC transporter permease, partial [Chloroflexota bacterium]|nr:ABC transporter permease [Chloroflexota bacterium]
PGLDAWHRFRVNWAAMVSLGALSFVVFIAIFAPFIHTANPTLPSYGTLDAGPSWHHWFGTDGVGRDQYSRLLYGLRVPLVVGAIGTLITVAIGALTGVVAGYAGGFLDMILSRFTDLIFAFPSFTLALIVVSLYGPAFDPYFGGGGRVLLLSVIFALVSWPFLMRFVRSLTLGIKEEQFVEAARVAGSTNWAIIRRHLLPNMWGLVLVQASFIVIGVISTETVLSIFGLGVQPPNPDLGQMLFDGVSRLDYNGWEVVFPSIALTVIILSLTFLGDGLRDAIDPRMNS